MDRLNEAAQDESAARMKDFERFHPDFKEKDTREGTTKSQNQDRLKLKEDQKQLEPPEVPRLRRSERIANRK